MVNEIEKILAIIHHQKEVRGRTRIQKLIYLLQKQDRIEIGYNFIPYHYGPYSQDLQRDINLLEVAGFLQVDHQEDNLYIHSLSKQGHDAARRIISEMENSDSQNLVNHLDCYREISTQTLIHRAKEFAGMLT